MDKRRYQTLEADQLIATLEIDEKGTVAQATIDPPLPAVLDVQLVKDAETWLFLPAVKNGQPQRVTVKLPLKVR